MPSMANFVINSCFVALADFVMNV